MTGYEAYIFVLCLVVFVALTVFFATLITYIVRMNVKLIRGGVVDADIRKQKRKETNRTAVGRVLEKCVSALFLATAITIFALSLSVKINEKQPVGRSVVKVVKSPSMATKDPFNKYLYENELNNQIQMFDLVKVSPLPSESELKLFDVVVYEVNGQMVIHRIVGINEPDETRAEREFILQGDANRYSDKFPVKYSQMKGIYAGTKVPYVGSFVIFMNSPAGYLCVLLVVFACIAYPVVDKKIKREIDSRMVRMGANASSEGQKNKNEFDEIIAYATSIDENKRVKNTRYEQKLSNGRVARRKK